MSTKSQPAALELGATGTCVAEGIREYRQKRQLSFADLEERLTSAGHRIHALGLRRIEARTRRVDVDDLMAIAAALNVSPLRLLLHIPDHGQGTPYEVATGLPEDVPWNEAIAWARDETGLHLDERIDFWRREIRVLERIASERTAQVQELTQKLAENPDDPEQLARLHRAAGLEDLSLSNHSEAIAMLTALETKKEAAM